MAELRDCNNCHVCIVRFVLSILANCYGYFCKIRCVLIGLGGELARRSQWRPARSAPPPSQIVEMLTFLFGAAALAQCTHHALRLRHAQHTHTHTHNVCHVRERVRTAQCCTTYMTYVACNLHRANTICATAANEMPVAAARCAMTYNVFNACVTLAFRSAP